VTDLAQWQRDNSQYLSASVEWLRARLAQLATHGEGAAAAAARVEAARAARAECEAMTPPPALLLLAAQLGLTTFEREIVLLTSAMDLDTRVARLCADAAGNPEQPYPTFALALAALPSPSWDALTLARPLRRLRMVDVAQGTAQPLTAAPVTADERIVNYVKGLNTLDPRIGLHLTRVARSAGALPPSQLASSTHVLSQWTSTWPATLPRVALLLGTDPDAKLLVAQDAAERLGRQLYRLNAETLPAQQAEIEGLVRIWQRECALMPMALFVDVPADTGPVDTTTVLDRFLAGAVESEGAIFVSAREPLARMRYGAFLVDVMRPTAEEQRDAWIGALTPLPEDERARAAGRLAAQFSLNLPELRAAAAIDQGDDYEQRVWDVCRDRTRPRVETLAQRIDVRATWDDLVVADETRRLLRDVAAQVRHRNTVYGDWGFARRMNRGLGISALFAGESGTGKTMAAEVIAQDLRLSLYRIDLSQVVSKWIGETEKNLQRVFDLMEGGGAVLFFDEADALFGKRSEVRDSHDRYANIEVSYLLQRMESYRGLAILTTNAKSALDQAFMRRLRFIVPFNFPGPTERRELWRKAFPGSVPTGALDYERLAKLSLTGASIQNIALNAAFLAASQGGEVTMPLVLAAARSELRKLERPVSEAELRV
jgi:hypothetical protein